MKVNICLIGLFISFTMLFSACVSMGVSSQGKSYFVGKNESVLTKYFGYMGDVQYDEEGKYDKILYFTNRVVGFTATKQNTTRYKVAKSNVIFNATYSEHDDGCYTLISTNHYETDNTWYMEDRPPYVKHNNNNAVVRSQIADYNNSIKRLNCIAPEYEDEYFKKSKIGDTYYVADVKKEAMYNKGFYSQIWGEVYPSETSVFYGLFIKRVDLVAEDRTETEKHVAATYNEFADQFYDEKENVISAERVDAICADYEKKGFTITKTESGLSVLAYIQNGKIVKVE